MLARRVIKSAFGGLRKISTRLEISPEIVKEIYKINTNAQYQEFPNSTQINQFQEKLRPLYKKKPDFKKFANKLYEVCNNSDVQSIAISFKREKELDRTEVNPFFQPTLIATSLMTGIGLVPFYDKESFLSHALINKDITGKITGHQDSMFLKLDNKYSSLIPTLLLVNGYSKSDAKTWFKESADIISELKERYPSSFKVLKQINFIGFPTDRIEDEENYTSQKIIGEHNDINFVSGFRYIPISKDLQEFKILKSEAELAILRFREVVNSKQNRHEFVLNNNKVQFLILKNQNGVHGRDQVEEDQRGHRLVVAIPLTSKEPPLTSIKAKTSVRIDKSEEKSIKNSLKIYC
jgi:hypothetical protein